MFSQDLLPSNKCDPTGEKISKSGHTLGVRSDLIIYENLP